jgi:hypothetical protein
VHPASGHFAGAVKKKETGKIQIVLEEVAVQQCGPVFCGSYSSVEQKYKDVSLRLPHCNVEIKLHFCHTFITTKFSQKHT